MSVYVVYDVYVVSVVRIRFVDNGSRRSQFVGRTPSRVRVTVEYGTTLR